MRILNKVSFVLTIFLFYTNDYFIMYYWEFKVAACIFLVITLILTLKNVIKNKIIKNILLPILSILIAYSIIEGTNAEVKVFDDPKLNKSIVIIDGIELLLPTTNQYLDFNNSYTVQTSSFCFKLKKSSFGRLNLTIGKTKIVYQKGLKLDINGKDYSKNIHSLFNLIQKPRLYIE